MTSLVPQINDISALRQRAEDQLDRIAYVEHATHLIPLGKRLQRHTHLLERHDLYVVWENDPNQRHPGIFLVKRNHSACARIWVCYNTIRIDTHQRWISDDYESSSWPWSKLMERDLGIDHDIAEQVIIRLLERDEIAFGNAYLPGKLTSDLDGALRVLPQFTQRTPAAVPPPTLELKAVEAQAVTPVALPPVRLAPKPLPRG